MDPENGMSPLNTPFCPKGRKRTAQESPGRMGCFPVQLPWNSFEKEIRRNSEVEKVGRVIGTRTLKLTVSSHLKIGLKAPKGNEKV